MKGNNTLVLNEATMIEAIQEYLDKRMPQHAPNVQAVTSAKGASYGLNTFEIEVTEKQLAGEG